PRSVAMMTQRDVIGSLRNSGIGVLQFILTDVLSCMVQNPKSENRNPKQTRNSKKQFSKPVLLPHSAFGSFQYFPLVRICFGFRISCFEFPLGLTLSRTAPDIALPIASMKNRTPSRFAARASTKVCRQTQPTPSRIPPAERRRCIHRT